MSSHSPSQASVCVCGEKMYWPFNGFCTRVGTGNASRYLLAHFHSTGGRTEHSQPQLQWETKEHAHNCPQEVANVRWGIRESVSHGEVTLGHIRHVPGLQVTVETFVGLAHPICQLDADGVWSALIGILLLQEKCVNTGY